MKKLSLSVVIILLLSAFLFTTVTADNTEKSASKYVLKYNVKKGKKFTMTGIRTNRQVQEQGGQEIVSNSESEYEYVLNMKSEKGNDIVLEMLYKNISFVSTNQMGTNSRDYSALIGKKAGFTLMQNGKTADFSGLEELPPVDIGNGLTANADYYKIVIDNLFPVMPDKAMDIGDTWTYEETIERRFLSEGGKITTKNSYTYKLLESTKKDGIDCLKLERTYTIQAEGQGQQQGLDITIEMEGEGTDTIYFAPDLGMFISLEKTEKAEGSASVPSMAMTIPMSSEVQSKQIVKFE